MATRLVTNALLGENPIKAYKKTILGQLLIKYWDALAKQEQELILQGNPRSGEGVFELYTPEEVRYFERANRVHISTGNLVEFVKPVDEEKEKTKSFESYTDEELKTIVNSKFLSLTSTLNKITSEPVLFRLKSIAEDEEKSSKIVAAIEARLSEVQMQGFAPLPKVEEDEETETEE